MRLVISRLKSVRERKAVRLANGIVLETHDEMEVRTGNLGY